MSEPSVSVIIPVYNSQQYLRQAVDSIAAQRYGPMQVIAVDDGSSDDSLGILHSYGDDVEVYEQKNAGSAAARNNGIRRAKGDFIAFLDADDLWHPDKTRIQIGHLLNNVHVGLVYANLLFAQQNQHDTIVEFLDKPVDEDVGVDADQSGWVYTKFLKESLLQTSSVIMRRSLVEKVGDFDDRLRKGQDYEYWIRASRESEFHKLSPKLSVYRINEEGITGKPSTENFGATIIESALSRWGRTGPDGSTISFLDARKRLSELWFDFAYLHEKKGDIKIAAEGYSKSMRYEPWRIRSILKFVICSRKAR